ncbi:hypothetical protein ABMA09_22770 [Erwinia rhapontici]|uniref:hypothetical protein n=1 Tax=Erwinia rhapontici TaxID=55212 RepID=UPI003D366200
MSEKKNYWVGTRPRSIKPFIETHSAMILEGDELLESLFRMYRRYVKQWNDIELDRSRSLAEHTHQVLGAQVVGANGRFILHGHNGNKDHWILDIVFIKGFSVYHPGLSTGKNALRTLADIKGVYLHWSENGKSAFEKWLVDERNMNISSGECNEYIK